MDFHRGYFTILKMALHLNVSVHLSSELQAQSTRISRTTTAKYMKKLGLKSIVRRKYKVRTTDSNHTNAIA